MVLKIDYNALKLQKVAYGVIFMTSWRLRHRKCVIKIQDFSIFESFP